MTQPNYEAPAYLTSEEAAVNPYDEWERCRTLVNLLDELGFRVVLEFLRSTS